MQRITGLSDPQYNALKFAALLAKCVPSFRPKDKFFGHKGITLDNLASIGPDEARAQMRNIFGNAPVTPEFAAYIIQMATPDTPYTLGFDPAGLFETKVTAEDVLEIAGVDFGRGVYGAFDPAQSREIERFWLDTLVEANANNAKTDSPLITAFLTAWRQSFERLYSRRNPPPNGFTSQPLQQSI